MRTFLIAVLLAGVALPALAARPNDDDRTERHHERADRSETLESSPKQERSAERPQHSVEQRHESSGNSGGALQSSAGNVRSRENSPIQTVEQVHGREVSIPVRESHEHQQAGKAGGNSRPHNFEPKEVRAPRGQREALDVRRGGDRKLAFQVRPPQVGEAGERRIEVLPVIDQHEMVEGHRGAERPADGARFRIEVVERGGVDEIDFKSLTADQMRDQWKSAHAAAGAKYIAAPGCSVPNSSTPAELSRFPRSLGALA